MKINYGARVDIGPKETNDDRILVSGKILDMTADSGIAEIPTVVAVCDGCGGYAGGGIAAETVLEFLSYETPDTLWDANYLLQVLNNCQQMVMEKKEEMPQYAAMCTTVAGCVFCNDCVVVFHSGDSRVYRYDRWGLARMTRDHSAVQNMIDMGEITPEEALTHPKRNVITRCIGVNGLPPEIYVSRTAITPGEKYLFCSDGLWEVVPEPEINEILSSDMTLQEMADALIEKALAQGAYDNISVCICAAQENADDAENHSY